MKKFLAVTTSLIAGALTLSGGAAAFAETDGTDAAEYYPASFETVPAFTNLTDYAVGDGKFLFLENNSVSEYGSERVVNYGAGRRTITALYFENGSFYYGTNDGKVYALENFNDEENNEVTDFVSTVETDKISAGDCYYHYDNDVLYVLENHDDVSLDGFSKLKRYGETVYAVKENVLYTLNGAESTPVKVQNFELSGKISVGGAYTKLTASPEAEPQFANLKNGAYMTEVDLDALEETSLTFVTGDTVKVNAASPALLLYTAGNATEGISVVAIDGKSYLIHPKDVTAVPGYPLKDTDFNKGTATEGFIYSAPYESKGTRVCVLPYGASVSIVKEIKKADNPALDHDFYYVEYQTDEDTSVKGYVRFGLLSTYTFNEEAPNPTDDPDETYEDLIKPVVLILIVLLLVAIAAGYLIYVGTSDKRKKKKEAASTDSNGQNK